MNFHNKPLPFEEKRQDRIAAAFISNCGPKNARNLVLDELMALLPGQIDSFGPCKNNANAESVLREKGWWEMTGAGHTRWNVKITTVSAVANRASVRGQELTQSPVARNVQVHDCDGKLERDRLRKPIRTVS